MRRIVEQIAKLSALLPELEDQAHIAEYESRRDGANVARKDKSRQAKEAASAAELERLKAIAALNGLGISLKGALEGLVDFPSYRNGEAIELCWKLGEEKVEHWHRIGEGYAGRKRI